jgi:hypothetical protein
VLAQKADKIEQNLALRFVPSILPDLAHCVDGALVARAAPQQQLGQAVVVPVAKL